MNDHASHSVVSAGLVFELSEDRQGADVFVVGANEAIIPRRVHQ